jgi:hypothetical protein
MAGERGELVQLKFTGVSALDRAAVSGEVYELGSTGLN